MTHIKTFLEKRDEVELAIHNNSWNSQVLHFSVNLKNSTEGLCKIAFGSSPTVQYSLSCVTRGQDQGKTGTVARVSPWSTEKFKAEFLAMP